MKPKNILKHNIITHASAGLLGSLFALFAIHMHSENKFDARQDAAVYATDARGRDAQLNRDIFNPSTCETVAWQYYTNQRVGEVLGKTAAKKYAIDMDALKNGTGTPEQMFGDERDYCSEAVVRAYRNAVSHLKFRRNNVRAVPFPKEHCDTTKSFQRAMRNARHMVKFFETDSVPNSIIKNPSESER